MTQLKRWLAILVAGFIVLSILGLASAFIGADFLIDLWWFDSLGYGFYFWQRLLYRYVVLGSVTLAFFLLFFLNFWVASRYLGTSDEEPVKARTRAVQAYKDLVTMFRTGSLWVYTPVSAVLAVIIALPLFEQWEKFLLYVFAPSTGVKENTFGLDISYFLFSYPIYSLLMRRLLLAFVLLFAALVILYLVEHRVLAKREENFPTQAKWHLSILIFIAFFIEIWHYVLQAQELVYTSSHQPLFFGAGFTEMNIIFPLICLTLVLLMGTAFSLIYALHKHRGYKTLAGFAVLFLLAFGARHSEFLPQTIQTYIVKPNEISKEGKYIERNVKATLSAFNLDQVETRNFTPQRVPLDIAEPSIKEELRNIPVWDGDLLEEVFQQLQQLRTYYDFTTVYADRYRVGNTYQQVFLAARELDHSLLAEGARNWVNDHLTYTHGYGAVMVPASQGGDEPLTWFIKGIPPESDYGMNIEQPGIYYGLGKYLYAIAPNDAGEFDYPKGNSNEYTNYAGKGGVPLSTLFKKAVFAYYFGDRDIFFTTKTNNNSKILFRQNIVERIKTLTPFFTLDRDPYLVVTSKKLYWIQDAYTTSYMYPYATRYYTGDQWVNYVRNSVKIVVDAYDGTVNYYLFDANDPIIRAYTRIYPGLIKDRSQMPPEVASQVRYPQDIFSLQMTAYAKYQQTNPDVFYQQEDAWEFAKTYKGREILNITPYYLTLDIITPPRFDFMLVLPMSPKGRDNLRAVAIAGCDGSNYGKVIVYNFPKGELVYGPSQIYALINQDTEVTEQFTLWDQVGSEVARGKMIILPVGKVILYIQPIYLKSATQLKIPELKRVIMSQGQVVVMDRSLEGAYAKLQERIQADLKRIDQRFAPLSEKPSPPPVAPSAAPSQAEAQPVTGTETAPPAGAQ